MTTERYKKNKKFLDLPQYPGGKQAMRDFLHTNLHYPPLAVANGIEGDVTILFDVDNRGKVLTTKVVHGLGHGCDEEATRLVMAMIFTPAANKGVRLTSHRRIRISFRLGNQSAEGSLEVSQKGDKELLQISYTYVGTPTTTTPHEPPKNDSGYSYTISW